MCNHEVMVKGIKTVIEALAILNYAVDCNEKGCENCPAHMPKAMRINGKITHCMLTLPGLLKMEIDNCME
jgi:hypothetical protein